jgi:hypothetical protein
VHAFRKELFRIVRGPTGGLLMSLGLAGLLGGVAMAAPATSFGHPSGQQQSSDDPATAVTPPASLAGSSRGAVVPSEVVSNDHASTHAGLGSANGRDTNPAAHGGQASANQGEGHDHAADGGSGAGSPRDRVPDQGDASTRADGAGSPDDPPVPDDHAVTPNGSAQGDHTPANSAGTAHP